MKYDGVKFKTRLDDEYIIKIDEEKDEFYSIIRIKDGSKGRWKEEDIEKYLGKDWRIIEQPMKKYICGGSVIAISQRYYRFEPNNETSWDKFGMTNRRDTYTSNIYKVEHIFDNIQEWRDYIKQLEEPKEFKKGDKVIVVKDFSDKDSNYAPSEYEGKEAIFERYLTVKDDQYFDGYRYVVLLEEVLDEELIVTEIKKVEKTMEKKIIGYKAPIDLFDGGVKKDTLYKFRTDFKAGQYMPVQERGNALYTMPKEIVETWEPVYEDEFKIGDWVVYTGKDITEVWYKNRLFQIKEINLEEKNSEIIPMDGVGGISIRSVRKATEEDFKEEDKIISNICFEGYKPTFKDDKVYFGCKEFTKDDIKSYLKLFDAFSYGDLHIRNSSIKNEHLARLFNKLK